MINILLIYFLSIFSFNEPGAEELVKQVKGKLGKVNDYQAKGKLRTNVTFIKAPISNVKVYYKKPDKLRIINDGGISFIPKGSVNINLSNVIDDNEEYNYIDAGRDEKGLRIIKLLPLNENSQIVLSTLYIDQRTLLIKKAKNTTRDNGTYELDMSYRNYSDYGLPDKVIFTFNTKEYKLPKGVSFDYDTGGKSQNTQKPAAKKGRIEIVYSSYVINKGISDSVFE